MTSNRSKDCFGLERCAQGNPIYRYMLVRDWEPSLPLLYVCMKNPSTATKDEDDRTTQTLRKRFDGLGIGGIHVVNLYAAIDPDPAILSSLNDPIGPENDHHIEHALRAARICISRPARASTAGG